MSRRRKRNPLLTRIILISVAVHAVALPIAAHYGAFEKLKQQFGTANVVLVTQTEVQRDKAEQKSEKKTAKTQTARKGPSVAHHAGPKSNLNMPKVVATTTQGGDSGGPTVDSGTGKAGEIPRPKTDPNAGGVTAPTPPPVTPNPTPPVVEKKEPVVEPKQPPVTPKKAAIFTSVEATFSPQPTIPDDLREEALDKTFVAEFTVASDGSPADVKVVQSTGIQELDQIALKTARQWRFRPATKDGEAVEGKVRLRIEFKVD
jgi:protein TonB